MNLPKGMHPGALWRKFDAQVHTPRDPNWQDGPPLAGGSEKNEIKRQEWATAFVQACIDNGVDAVSITDHHDFCLAEYVREVISESGINDKLWLFPGVEVTTNDGFQCLVLLDRDASSTDCSRVLSALPNVSQTSKDAPQLPDVEPCGRTLSELLEQLTAISQINDRFILLPNGSKSDGHKTILKQGNHVTFRQLDVDGVYLDGPFGHLSSADRKKVHGLTPQWGTRRRGILPTSDARTLQDIGTHPCWIRLGEPTAEAIRQALLVDQARVSYSSPRSPATVIDTLTVRSTLTGGERTFRLNEGLNAVIGGRGSGKSALLEYLRFGLGRSTADLFPSGDEYARARSLVHDTLHDGYVVLKIVRDGVRETWSRNLESPDTITVQVEDDQFSLSISDAHGRLQARGYHQKQLSSLMQDPESAREQITGLVAAESLSTESRIRHELRNRQSAATSVIGRYERSVRDAQSVLDLGIKGDDIIRRLQSVSQSLQEGGLSTDQQRILNVLPEYDEFAQQISETSNHSKQIESDVSDLLTEAKKVDIARPDWVDNVEGLGNSLHVIRTARAAAVSSLEESLKRIRTLTKATGAVTATFQPAHKAIRKSASQVQQKQTELKQLVNQQNELNKQLVDVRQSIRELEKTREGPEQISDELNLEIAKIHKSSEELSTLLKEAAQQAEELGGGLIRADVRDPDEPESLVSSLVAVGEKCHIVDLETKCRTAARGIMADGWKSAIDNLSKALLRLLAHHVRNEDNLGNVSPENCKEILGSTYIEGLTDNQAIRLCQNITPERLAGILFFVPEPYVEFRYQDHGDQYIEFSRASPGQQASALLEILLNQRAGPLIIDQPEDDLDNQRIMTIVETLQTTKQNRQLIFATHNPNFVVNGDADKIIALASPESTSGGEHSSRLRIRIDGALETQKVREEITETMEGGRRAFELRRRKYRFPE